MVWKIENVSDIKTWHHGYAALHLVRQAPVCAPCARAAFNDGETVTAGSFDEGDTIECDCGNLIQSTYGRYEG